MAELSTRWLILALFILSLALSACEEGGERFTTSPPPSAPPAPSYKPAKGVRTYYLVAEEKKCNIYWVEDGQRSVTRSRACPREVAPGEKIRLTGRTCMRESLEQARNVPVRCPRELYKAAEADRSGEGPEQLPAASATR